MRSARMPVRLRRLAPVAIVAMASPALAHAQTAPNAAVDRVFAEWNRPDSPGCALGVVQNGKFVYQHGYGMANLDYDIPNGPDMVYYVGSDSKQFTAATIALLSLQGKLSLDDDVRKYFPSMPDYGTPITIRNLIHHTSGIRDIYSLMSLRGDRMEDVFPDSAALALILRQQGLGFRPGSEYSYTNSGYFLLAQIVRQVTGKPLRVVADEQIFRPLGMTHTHFHDDPGHVMKRRAMSYERDGAGAYRISYLQSFDKVGAGGLYTTLDDLRKWDENYYTHQIGGDALQKLIHTRGMLTNGDTLPYAFGNEIGTHRGLRTTEHSGALMGYKADVLRFPDQHLSVLITCNLGSIDPAQLALSVADVYLGNRMTPRRAATAASRSTTAVPTLGAVPSADVARMLGTYYSDDLDVTYRVVRVDAGSIALVPPRGAAVPILAASDGSYRAGGIALRVEPDAIVMRVSRIGEMRLVRR